MLSNERKTIWCRLETAIRSASLLEKGDVLSDVAHEEHRFVLSEERGVADFRGVRDRHRESKAGCRHVPKLAGLVVREAHLSIIGDNLFERNHDSLPCMVRTKGLEPLASTLATSRSGR